MNNRDKKIPKAMAVFIVALSFCLFNSIANAQQRMQGVQPPPPSPPAPVDNPGGRAYGGYMIGTGDILNIRIAEEEDVSGRYQVDTHGDVKLPLLSQPVHADGQSTFEFSKQLAAILKDQQILKEPYVTVFIERGMTQQITIAGPVARPGIYPIEHTTRLLDVLGMSGGLLPGAGQTITVVRPMAEQDSPTTIKGGVTEIDVGTLMSGQKPESNVEVHAGDQITVAGSSIVYVVGAVIRPGAFTVQDPRFGMSVLRALALVEGAQPTASLNKAIIVRQSTSDVAREEIPLDLAKIMKGKDKDPVLLANDILFVPQSGMKQTLKKMGDIATIAAGQALGYGLGLTLANH